jgi:hypothetical protein
VDWGQAVTKRETFFYSMAVFALAAMCWLFYTASSESDVLQAVNVYAYAIVFANVATMLMILGYMVGQEGDKP